MTSNEYMTMADENLIHTYNRFPVVLDHGEGVYLYDHDGKKYLDFAAGIAVFALGYHHPAFTEGVKAQMDQIIHTSNLFYSKPLAEAAKKLCEVSGMDKAFFTNSGTEAIEGAIKLAKKYAFLKDGSVDHEIIAMNHSFHGRSMGALAVTGNKHYQEAFGPMIPGIRFADYNDLASVEALVNEKTCAIILETVQGEGGIRPATKEFLTGIRTICDEKDILLILDEIQCGYGRTGTMFAFEQYGIRPDVLTVAKALGCGIPVGAFLASGKCAEALVPGDHGTTYGGNPLATAAVNQVLDIFANEGIVSYAKAIAPYLWENLESLKDEFAVIKDHRGLGLIQGLEFDESLPVGKVVSAAIERGLIVISASGNVLRFVPPLVITRENIDEMMEKLKDAISSVM